MQRQEVEVQNRCAAVTSQDIDLSASECLQEHVVRARSLIDDSAILLLVETESPFGARFVRLPDHEVCLLRRSMETIAVRARPRARREDHLLPHVAVVAVVGVVVQQAVEVVNVAATAPVVNDRQSTAVALGGELQVRDWCAVLIRPDRDIVDVDRSLQQPSKLFAFSCRVQVLFKIFRNQIDVDA